MNSLSSQEYLNACNAIREIEKTIDKERATGMEKPNEGERAKGVEKTKTLERAR